jgi:hypothetical protein
LTYKRRDYAFNDRADGTFREVDTEMITVELPVRCSIYFNGRYHKIEMRDQSAVALL